MVLQHERQFRISILVDESKILINSVNFPKSQGRGRGNRGSSSTSGSKRIYSFCGRSNHTIDTCYRKHGFPPNFGASDKICSSIRVFDSYQSIKHVHIKLPNGNMDIAKFYDTVQFSPSLVAKNVLYVVEFKLNLLSVPKLCVDSDYIVTSDNHKCLI